MVVETRNPATGGLIKAYDEMTDSQLDEIVNQADEAYQAWRKTSFADRGICMRKLAQMLKSNTDEYASIITLEMGKPIKQARAEILKCAWICEHYAEHAEEYLSSQHIQTEMSKSFVCYNPLGVIFAIMPWNFPFWQVLRFAAPNIMAGNVGILSHAPISTGAALKIEQLFLDAGFPKGVFSSVIVSNERAAKIIANPAIIGVTLTGSERAGKAVGMEAASNLKKVVLELGGSDPYIILEDTDVAQTAEVCVKGRLLCSGQVCISPKRIIVVDEIYDDFEQQVVKLVADYKPSDPNSENCNLGPMARGDLRAELHEQVQQSIAKGANCLSGGVLPEGSGYYYPATILTNVQPGMPAYDQELFGPVIALIRAKNEEDAIRIANDSPYGLGAAVFTGDIERGERIAAEHLDAGVCSVNTTVGSDPRTPFGGIKLSGYGRECAAEGIREFMNIKTVNIK